MLIILGVTSLGVYGVALAGWSSNSKYSLLGGLRASAQMISYEISLGLSLVGVLMLTGSFSLRDIVDAQSGVFWGFIPRWNIFYGGQFVAFFIYLMSAYAETNRIPFDLPEAETELVAGYHTEYSAMKFAMFFMAEYANMITVAAVASLLFLGGWHGPVFGPPLMQALLPVFWFVFGYSAFSLYISGCGVRCRGFVMTSYGFWMEISVATGDCEPGDHGFGGGDAGVESSQFPVSVFWFSVTAMLHLIIFLAFGALCVAGAVNLLVQRHPINSALSLVVVMGSLAVEYLLLGAEFVAAVQVIVYAGAIMVLFVFVIMLLNAGEEERTKGSRVAMLFGVPGNAGGQRAGRLGADRAHRQPKPCRPGPCRARRRQSAGCCFTIFCCRLKSLRFWC